MPITYKELVKQMHSEQRAWDVEMQRKQREQRQDEYYDVLGREIEEHPIGLRRKRQLISF
jgi:hypothetical protein